MFETLAADVLELADSGEVIIMTDEEENKIRALVKLDDIEDTYLLIGRLVDSKVIDHMENAQSAVNEYRRLSDQISGIQIQFSVVFLLVALLLLLVAIWYGMYFAQRLVIPLSRLIGASERIRGGDFTARVETRADDDEIARLGRSFNRMTERLESQRGELIDINRQMDERRRFSEAVLEGVSAGVIALDEQKHISLVNKSADQLLHDLQLNEHWGKELTKLIPEITSLLEDAERKPERGAQGQVILKIKSSVLILHVRVTIEAFDGKIEGYIVTLDDLSELSAAQRTAAWSDVARRIAHEIKNPLTPIQLSAERLKRKYGEQIDSDREAFDRYIDTISRHVTDIGHMVEEFVSFARMPKPVFKQKDIVSIIRKAVFSERTS
jgi:two-component system nitrogen regulation sensor histidine kinase NtrY